MKTIREILIVATVLGSAELFWMETYADQARLDEGVAYGQDLLGEVQNLSTTTDANSVPGFNGINLPQTDYFTNQDLNGLKTDAITDLGSGTASEASQYAYDKAFQPNLSFGANDPILLNSSSVSTNAMLNPDVLTVPTGNCAIQNVNTPQTSTEHCTAWKIPTQHNCSKSLNVDVSWEDVSNCPIGTRYSAAQTVHSTARVWDIVHARAVCNPATGPDAVQIEVFATDTIGPGDPPDCTGWTPITVSTNQVSEIYTGVELRPTFHGGHCAYLPTFVQGRCVNNQCDYDISFYELRPKTRNNCFGTNVDLGSKGYTDGPSRYKTGNKYCVLRSSSVSISFEKPSITRTSTVTESWNNGCAFLEAQLP